MVFKWPADWRDPDAMSYFISDFASSNIRPARKLAFWSNLICNVCQYRKTPFITITELKRCLAWRGVAPMCLFGVLDDMQTKQTVLKLEKLTETWSQWSVGLLTYPVTSVWNKLLNSSTEQKFVVVSVLEECRSKLLKHVHQEDNLLFKSPEWNKLVKEFVNSSNIEQFNNYLVFTCDIILRGDPATLVKVRASNHKKVEAISQIDIAIGKAQTTKDTLNTQIKSLNDKISESTAAAKAAKNKNTALSHLRRRKMYQKSIEKWEGALNNTESLLLQLYDNQHHKIIVSTLKVGADALQQNKVSLKEVDDIMDELEEYKNYEDDLNTAMSFETASMSDMSLSEELEQLLEPQEPPHKKQSIAPEVIDLTNDNENEDQVNPDNVLTQEEIDELEELGMKLHECPTPPMDAIQPVFEETEHPIERETVPENIKARLSPELRRKPGRKLIGTLME